MNIGAADSDTVMIGQPLPLADMGGPPNLELTVAEADTYAFTLDMSRDGPVLLVRKAADVPRSGPPPEPALQTPLDFDDMAMDYQFEDSAGTTTMLVADPLADDAMNMVASTTKTMGSAEDASTGIVLENAAIAFDEQLTHIAMRVYVANGSGTVALTIADSGGDATLSAMADYSGSGAWETLYLDFSAFDETAHYDTLRLVFDHGVLGDGRTWLWDDLRLSEPPPGTAPPYGNTTVYVRGLANDWGTTNAMTFIGDGVYHLDIELMPHEEGSHPFKVASEDWSTVNFGAMDAESTTVALNTAMVLASPGENFAFAVAEAGSYRFRLDANDSAAPVLTVIDLGTAPFGDTAIYARGAFNEWGTGNPLHYVGGGAYQGVVAVEAGEPAFKVASEDWATVNLGAADAAATTVVDWHGLCRFPRRQQRQPDAGRNRGEHLPVHLRCRQRRRTRLVGRALQAVRQHGRVRARRHERLGRHASAGLQGRRHLLGGHRPRSAELRVQGGVRGLGHRQPGRRRRCRRATSPSALRSPAWCRMAKPT